MLNASDIFGIHDQRPMCIPGAIFRISPLPCDDGDAGSVLWRGDVNMLFPSLNRQRCVGLREPFLATTVHYTTDRYGIFSKAFLRQYRWRVVTVNATRPIHTT